MQKSELVIKCSHCGGPLEYAREYRCSWCGYYFKINHTLKSWIDDPLSLVKPMMPLIAAMAFSKILPKLSKGGKK